jgi:hypothetical protein
LLVSLSLSFSSSLSLSFSFFFSLSCAFSFVVHFIFLFEVIVFSQTYSNNQNDNYLRIIQRNTWIHWYHDCWYLKSFWDENDWWEIWKSGGVFMTLIAHYLLFAIYKTWK